MVDTICARVFDHLKAFHPGEIDDPEITEIKSKILQVVLRSVHACRARFVCLRALDFRKDWFVAIV